MSFSSRKEKGFWISAVIVVLLIFSTMFYAPILRNWVSEYHMLQGLFVVAFFMVVIMLVLYAIWSKPSIRQLAVGIGIAAVALLFLMRLHLPEERTHLMEYSVLALLIHSAFNERKNNGKLGASPLLLAFLLAFLIGLMDEVVQSMFPDRNFQLEDIAFNFIAVSFATGSVLIMNLVKRIPIRPKTR